jgi:C1A family cysteine protease
MEKQKHNLRGWHRDLPDNRDFILKTPLMSRLGFGLPTEVDLRKQHLPRIENQSTEGSCTCNSGTSAVEEVSIKLGRPVVELSRNFLYYATRQWIEHTSGDVGAQIRDVMKALAKFGVCSEATWPYDVNGYDKPPSPAAITEAKKRVITQYWRCPSMRAIKVCLAQGWPLAGGFTCFESLETEAVTKTGVVPYPKHGEGVIGGHAVLFCGYSDAHQWLIFANSWGTGWGDRGYGYLPYTYVTNWLADDFWTVRMATGA